MRSEEMMCSFAIDLAGDSKDGKHLRSMEDLEDCRVEIQYRQSFGKDQGIYFIPQLGWKGEEGKFPNLLRRCVTFIFRRVRRGICR